MRKAQIFQNKNHCGDVMFLLTYNRHQLQKFHSSEKKHLKKQHLPLSSINSANNLSV